MNNGISQTNAAGVNSSNGFITITSLASAPTITTTSASNISFFAATSGGNVTSDGGATVTARGIVWSTSPSPTIALSTKTTESGTTGAFSSNLTGLRSNTVYYVRAYATNSTGTSYGSEILLQTLEYFAPLVLSSFQDNTIAYGTGNDPFVITTQAFDGMSSVLFTNQYGQANGRADNGVPTSGIVPVSNGFFQFAPPPLGTIWISTQSQQYTLPILSSLRYSKLSLLGGSANGSSIVQAIVRYTGGSSTVANNLSLQDWNNGVTPVMSSLSRVSRDTNSFDSTINICLYSNTFSVNSTQAVSSLTILYTSPSGPVLNVFGMSGSTVPEVPQLTTATATSVVYTSATSGGVVTYDGNADISARGVVWSTSPNPTVALATKTVESGTTGSFVSNLTSLSPGTLYYVRSYATNSVGTGYGNQITFSTPPPDPPTVSATATVSSIAYTTATSGGTVSSDNGATITARGVVWDVSPNPTVALATKTVQTGTTGSFVSNLTGLTANTLYYVRAYATNSAGTGYGPQVSFSTLPPQVPIVASTTASSAISFYTATSGGNVSSEEGATITARGVVWDVSPNPTVA